MVLNPNYNEEHDWEVVSARSSYEDSSWPEDHTHPDARTAEETERQHLLTTPASVLETIHVNQKEGNVLNDVDHSNLNSTAGDLSAETVTRTQEPSPAPSAENVFYLQPAKPSLCDTLGNSVRTVTDTIGKEGRKLGSTINTESKRSSMSIQSLGDSVQTKSKTIGSTIGSESKRIGQVSLLIVQDITDQLFMNDSSSLQGGTATATSVPLEHKIKMVTDILTAVAIIGGGTLLVKGNRGAGASVLATGGAAYMASEIMREASGRRRDSGLNEDSGSHME